MRIAARDMDRFAEFMWEVKRLAERRMFARTVVNSDIFLDMPATTPRILREVLLREARNELERIAQGAGD